MKQAGHDLIGVTMKLFAALLALTLSLAGCGPVDGDPIRSGAAASDSASRPDAVTVAQLRQMLHYMLREEAYTGHTEFYQLPSTLRLRYDRRKGDFDYFTYCGREVGKEIGDDALFTVGLQNYHFKNIESFFNISYDTLCKLQKPRSVATSCQDILMEYFREHEMLDAVVDELPGQAEEDEDEDAIKVAVIGKPNAGKSSLVNKILGEERVIVSNVAGTTRDAIDSRFTNDKGSFVFIDTAGMRKKSKIEEDIEKYSVLRATMAIDRADVCLIMIDATEGVTEQDTKVAGEAHNAGKACIIVVNKWDLVEKDGSTMKEYTLRVREGLAYMPYAPVLFISAQTGQRVDKLFSLIHEVYEQNHMRIPTGRLNAILAEATARVQPPTDKGRRLRIFYMTQASTCPPTFVCFCNDARLFHFSYQRYLENQIREVFGLTGTPVRMVIRERSDKSQ